MAKLFSQATYQALDSSGDPISGAKWNFYLTGTSTRHDTFTDNALSVAHANPVVSDSSGIFAPIYLQDADYKAVLTDAADVVIQTVDPVHGAEAVDPADLDAANIFTKTTTWKHGVDVASAAALILGDGNIFDITGVADIDSIGTKGVGTIIELMARGAWTLKNSATNIVCPGGQDIVARSGDAFRLKEYATGDWELVNYQSGVDINPLPTNYITGCEISNNATDAVNDIDVAVGVARDTADTANLKIASAIGKQIDVSWAAGGTPGAPTGGLSSSLTVANDTWYHVILGKVSGVVEVGIDTSVTGANLVTDHSFTNIRRIGSVLRGTALIELFIQVDNEFFWLDPPLDNDATQTTTASSITLSTPLGIKTRAKMNAYKTGAGASIYLSSLDVNDEVSSSTAAPLGQVVAASAEDDAGQVDIWTDTSSQIRASSSGSTTLRIVTVGWKDLRG